MNTNGNQLNCMKTDGNHMQSMQTGETQLKFMRSKVNGNQKPTNGIEGHPMKLLTHNGPRWKPVNITYNRVTSVENDGHQMTTEIDEHQLNISGTQLKSIEAIKLSLKVT